MERITLEEVVKILEENKEHLNYEGDSDE